MKSKTKKLMIFVFDSWCMDHVESSIQQLHAWLMVNVNETSQSPSKWRPESFKTNIQTTKGEMMEKLIRKNLPINMLYLTISFSSKDIEHTLMLKSAHQSLPSNTFLSTFTKDLIVQISILHLKMERRKSSIMTKFRPSKTQDMSVDLKHVGAFMSSVCIRTHIRFTDFPFINLTESESNIGKEKKNRLYKKPK